MNGLADVGSKTIDNFVSAKKSVANLAGNSIKSVGEVAANTIDNIGDIVDETIDFTGYVKKKGIVGVIDTYEKFGKIKIDDNFKLPEETFTTGVSEDDYNKIVAFKLKENRELAKQIKPIEADLLSEKDIIDAIQKEYNDIDYNYGIELDRWDANVHEQFIALRNDLADEEVLKSHGLSLADKNLTEEELLAKSHKNEDYISLKTWRKEAVEELFNKYEMTKGFKEEDYEKFTVIKNDNLKNLEVLKAVRKNNENEYNQMEYNCLTVLEDYKKVEDQLSRMIDNPVGDEKYVNQLGGQYLSIYNYLKMTNPSKAKSYLKAIEDPINQKKGEEKALARIAELSKDSEGNVKDSLLNEINVAGYGFGDGLVDFGEGIYKIIDDDMTVQDYEVMVYLSYLTSMQNNVYSTAQSIGNMTIPIAASTLVGLFAPEAQPFVSSALIGSSAYGNTKAQMLYEGYDRKTAMLYAGCTATSDAVLEVLFGGIENIGLSTLTDSAEKLTLRQFAAKQVKEMIQEGGEEVLQDFVKSSVFDQKILHKTFDISEFSEQALQTFLQSALVAGVLNGGQTMVQVAVEGSTGTLYADDIMAILERSQNGENINDVVNEVLEHNTNSDSSSVIESIDNNTNTQDNTSNITPIKVSEIESSNSMFDKVFNVKNVYTDYDYVYKADSNIDSVIDQVISDNLGGNILIEVGRFDVLSEEIINKLPDNVNVRVIGSYDTDTMNSFKNPASAENSGRNTIYTKEQLLSINEKLTQIDSLVDENWSDQEKVEFLYKYLRDNVPYNVRPTSRDAKYESLVGLIEDESTCQGFAHIFDELCSRYGIECKEVFGTFDGHTSHAYNVVKIDGKDYVVDCVREHLDGKNGCLTSGDDIANYTSRGVNGYLLDSAKANTHSITTDNKLSSEQIEIKKAQESLKNYTDKLFNPAEALNDNSGKYNVTYTNYNGKQVPIINVTGEFDMLVHGVPVINHTQTGTAQIVEQLADNPQIWMDMNRPGANFISTSNISDVKSKFMQRGNLVLGFSNIAEDQISKVWPGDDRTPMIQSPIEQRELQYNTFKNIEDLSDKNKLQYSNYSEIVMNRYIKDENGELTKYPPNYLLITDGVISDVTLKWADYFGIPLVNIDSKNYAREGLNGVQKLINDMPLDNYVLSEQKLGELINYANKTTWYNYDSEYNIYNLINNNIGKDGTLTMTSELKNQLLYAVDHHLKFLEGTDYRDIIHKDYKSAIKFDELSSKKIGDLNDKEISYLLHDQNFKDICSEICQDIVDLGYDWYCDSQGLHIYGDKNDINNLKLPGLKPVFDEALYAEVINIPYDQNSSMINNIHNLRSILTKTSNNSSELGLDNSTKSYLNEISGSDNLSASQQNGIDSSLQSLAFKIGSDSDTVKEALEVKMNNIINDSEFGVRVDEKALSSILDTGLKNQFETNSSGGALNKTKRLSAEKNLFNVPVDSLDSDRPVYGMVFPKYDDYSQFYKRGPGSFYAILQQRDSNGKLELDSSGYGIIANNPETGERYSSAVILLKKDNIINNTTFTMGDSLDVGISKLNGQATIQGSLATNPTFKGADNRIFDSINSLDDIKNADLQTFFPANDFRSNRYMELQIHGQENHDVSNIKEVIFTSGTVSDSIIKKLESKGIPYKIMPRFE